MRLAEKCLGAFVLATVSTLFFLYLSSFIRLTRRRKPRAIVNDITKVSNQKPKSLSGKPASSDKKLTIIEISIVTKKSRNPVIAPSRGCMAFQTLLIIPMMMACRIANKTVILVVRKFSF